MHQPSKPSHAPGQPLCLLYIVPQPAVHSRARDAASSSHVCSVHHAPHRLAKPSIHLPPHHTTPILCYYHSASPMCGVLQDSRSTSGVRAAVHLKAGKSAHGQPVMRSAGSTTDTMNAEEVLMLNLYCYCGQHPAHVGLQA